MYLSRVIMDDKNRETMRLLSSLEYLHGAVERGFAGEKQRKLWRIDWLHGQCCLLVLSPTAPDFSEMVAKYGFADQEPAFESKPYQPLLDRLQAGQTWQFRLKANPVRSLKQEESRGKVVAHVTTAQQKEWLQRRSADCGFELTPDTFEVVHTQWHRFHKARGHLITLRTATFEGSLTIRDADLMRQTLQNGIGRAKAYGCGLLTLAAPQNIRHV